VFRSTSTIPGRGSSGTVVLDLPTLQPAHNCSRARSKSVSFVASSTNLAFYPVDLKGVQPEAAKTTAADTSIIKALADFTGGKALFSDNNVLLGMRQAAEDSSVVYTLGFYPEIADGKFHSLKITAKRRGVQLRYQRGYFADDGAATEDARLEGREPMRNAMLDPFDRSDIHFALSRELIGPEPARALRLKLSIAPRDLQMGQSGSVWQATLDVAYSMRDRTGCELANDGTQVNLEFTGHAYQIALKDGISLSREVKLLPGAAEVRLVLFDRVSGRLGSLSFPVR
jgi:hypothetical protein